MVNEKNGEGIIVYTDEIVELWRDDGAVEAQNLTLELADKFGITETRQYLLGLQQSNIVTTDQYNEMVMTLDKDGPF